MKKSRAYRTLTVNVLGYQEEGEWVALALEMDIRGYGQSFEEALEDLIDLVNMQLSFAEFKDHPEMAFHPAEPVWFSLFAQVRQDRLLHYARPAEAEYEIAGIPMPSPQVIEKEKTKFSLTDG